MERQDKKQVHTKSSRSGEYIKESDRKMNEVGMLEDNHLNMPAGE